MMISADKINDMRRRVLAGDIPVTEELRSAVETLLGERIAAHEATPKKRTAKTKAPPIDLDDMLE